MSFVRFQFVHDVPLYVREGHREDFSLSIAILYAAIYFDANMFRPFSPELKFATVHKHPTIIGAHRIKGAIGEEQVLFQGQPILRKWTGIRAAALNFLPTDQVPREDYPFCLSATGFIRFTRWLTGLSAFAPEAIRLAIQRIPANAISLPFISVTSFYHYYDRHPWHRVIR